jgi:dethiobiotin synthetase
MLIVAGIGTEVGKTVVSAVLVEALEADYWKPVQSGSEALTDTQTVAQLVTPLASRTFYPEAYQLKAPLSPHAAAELENITIDTSQLLLPQTSKSLVVELAGGILVPITSNFLNIHLLEKWQLPVVIVSRYYLGSINHTLLTIEVLKKYQIPILGIVFNGECVQASKKVILEYSQVPLLGEIPFSETITPHFIKKEAEKMKGFFALIS